MTFNWPQYVWFGLAAWAIGSAWVNNGKPHSGNVNVATVAATTCASGALLWAGGFFG